MSPLHLIWIVPASAIVGIIATLVLLSYLLGDALNTRLRM